MVSAPIGFLLECQCSLGVIADAQDFDLSSLLGGITSNPVVFAVSVK